MNGKKTYTFLLIAFLGWIGIGDLITNEQAADLVSAVISLVGIIGAAWGRYVARPR